MLPNEVKSAITRQKVRHVPSGAIGDVIAPQEKHGLVDDVVPGVAVFTKDKGVQVWALECCEPVPEEPRPFRVGDKVVVTDKSGNIAYSTVRAVFHDGRKIINGLEMPSLMPDGQVRFDTLTTTRHATPEELKLHF